MQITIIKKEGRDIAANSTDVYRIIRKCYDNKINNLNEVHRLPEF